METKTARSECPRRFCGGYWKEERRYGVKIHHVDPIRCVGSCFLRNNSFLLSPFGATNAFRFCLLKQQIASDFSKRSQEFVSFPPLTVTNRFRYRRKKPQIDRKMVGVRNERFSGLSQDVTDPSRDCRKRQQAVFGFATLCNRPLPILSGVQRTIFGVVGLICYPLHQLFCCSGTGIVQHSLPCLVRVDAVRGEQRQDGTMV